MNDRLHVCSSVHEGNWSTDVEEKDEAHGTIVNLGREMSLCSITKQCKPVVRLLAAVQQCTFKQKRQNIQQLQRKERRKKAHGGGENIFRKWWQALHVQKTRRTRKTALNFWWNCPSSSFCDDRKKINLKWFKNQLQIGWLFFHFLQW